MNKPDSKNWIDRSEVRLSETVLRNMAGEAIPTGWEASISTALPTGEHVDMWRHGVSAADAYENLVSAAAGQGWLIE